MASPAFALLFGLACTPPCSLTGQEREKIEKEAIRVLTEHGFSVKPAPEDTVRPTSLERASELVDEAKRLDVDRVVVLDLEPQAHGVWVTQFVRGAQGPWSVGQVICAREKEKDKDKAVVCPELERVLVSGLRPRTADDLDVVSLLRRNSTKVEACMAAEDEVPIEERVFGRVEIDLEASPKGTVRVTAIAPALVAKRSLGQCLRRAMESMNVGAFEGEPIKFRIPVDLD
jgi:hypothetical protein